MVRNPWPFPGHSIPKTKSEAFFFWKTPTGENGQLFHLMGKHRYVIEFAGNLFGVSRILFELLLFFSPLVLVSANQNLTNQI